MELFIGQFLEGTSFRHSDGRAFWSNIGVIRDEAYTCWEFWPDCEYPTHKPNISVDLFKNIAALIELLPSPSLPQKTDLLQIPKLSWCLSNWLQLEIALRHLAIHIDDIYDTYGSHSKKMVAEKSKSDVIKCLKLLRDYLIQLQWWFNALLIP